MCCEWPTVAVAVGAHCPSRRSVTGCTCLVWRHWGRSNSAVPWPCFVYFQVPFSSLSYFISFFSTTFSSWHAPHFLFPRVIRHDSVLERLCRPFFLLFFSGGLLFRSPLCFVPPADTPIFRNQPLQRPASSFSSLYRSFVFPRSSVGSVHALTMAAGRM